MNAEYITAGLDDNDRGITFLQVPDIQKMMGISRASAYALVKSKGFPHIIVGNRIVIPFDLFNKWVEESALSFDGRC